MWFLAKFFGLLAVSGALTLVAMRAWAWFVTRREESEEERKRKLSEKFQDMLDDNDIPWYAGIVTTGLTFLIALESPGSPLFPDAIRTIPGVQTLVDYWGWFFHGKLYQPPASIPSLATWFWWEATVLLGLLTALYTTIAFRDEVGYAALKIWNFIQARRSREGAATPEEPHRPEGKHGIGLAILILSDFVAAFAAEFLSKKVRV
ncbi:MAG: hypothetical protein A2946_03220 [Candidatus Liptonbacteria bacterium RIFCSPLOWO2_01_FULL_53_13]|uniref:Uncharacterized protein n=1 Tax=Candidatus Liptonbacteria bacterium RIFCSPLOWO2_01_FULL_53_13 TaxID=1798651 RepID=A0A1G2CGS1_9BACT|nr:MAG: hypothetical protein A2946_03220 [Candidatus Liptonbacteria bacterium RIFCSPLOWO2_01_FULL_53_13]